MHRRSFLTGLLATPFLVRASSLDFIPRARADLIDLFNAKIRILERDLARDMNAAFDAALNAPSGYRYVAPWNDSDFAYLRGQAVPDAGLL